LPEIDFRAHAESLGAVAEWVATVGELPAAMAWAKGSPSTHVIVIETDPMIATEAGGHWWDVPVAEVSEHAEVRGRAGGV
jgi:3D-(3,5/4)-trihydroxycyclohexane-1,2-dione acylhydrolase (decyclizing)